MAKDLVTLSDKGEIETYYVFHNPKKYIYYWYSINSEKTLLLIINYINLKFH